MLSYLNPRAMARPRDPRPWLNRLCSNPSTITTGHAELDLSLPGHGWPVGGLVELLHDSPGLSELQLIVPALTRLSRQRHIALIAPPFAVNAAVLASIGANLPRITILPQRSDADRDWAGAHCLRSGAYGAVLIWASHMRHDDLHALQQACERGQSTGFLFRPSQFAAQASPASLRVQLGPQTQVELVKARGGIVQKLWWQQPLPSPASPPNLGMPQASPAVHPA